MAFLERVARKVRTADQPVIDEAHQTVGEAYVFPLENEPAWRGQPFALEIPNSVLRGASSTADLGSWYAIGEAWAHIIMAISPSREPAVLDVGCGCGKMARFLFLTSMKRFMGLDVHAPAIAWCKREFASDDRFEFAHLDVRAANYNPSGTLEPESVSLPVADESFDVAICASLFTHLKDQAMDRYLSEVARALRHHGRLVASIHIDVDGGEIKGDELRIDVAPNLFLGKAERAGLFMHTHVGNVYGQQVYVFERR